MRSTCALVVVVGLAACCVVSAGELADEQDAPQTAVTPAQVPANLSRAEHEARTDLTLAQSRLELVLARKALRSGQVRNAAVRAQRVLALLKVLPRELDASEYELQAEGILARAAKAGVDVAALAEQTSTTAPAGFDDYLDDQTAAAATVAHRYTGADRDTIDTRVDAATLRQRTLQRQRPDDRGYGPGKEIFDVDTIQERDRQRVYYEGALWEAYSADAARLMTEADEARVVPAGEIAYPDDWPEKTAKRARYADGEIARSQSWTDQDGHEWYVAIYDVNDLIRVPPKVAVTITPSLAESMYQAFGWHSWHWGWGPFGCGYPWYAGGGLPLSRYFGGLDGFGWRTPMYSPERQEQIVEMINAFTTRSTESQVIPLAPPEQSGAADR